MLKFHTYEILLLKRTRGRDNNLLLTIICIFLLCIALKTAELSTMSTCHLLTL